MREGTSEKRKIVKESSPLFLVPSNSFLFFFFFCEFRTFFFFFILFFNFYLLPLAPFLKTKV